MKSTMENQHYVPQSYLKQFCIQGTNELFGSRFIVSIDNWTKPKKYPTQAICYSGDFYNINDELPGNELLEKDSIERKAFYYEQSLLDTILDQVKDKKLSSESIKDFAFFFLSMKARNPKFRDKYSLERIEYNLQTTLKKVVERHKLTQKQKESLQRELEFITNEGTLNKDLHNVSIHRAHFTKDSIMNKHYERLKNYFALVLEPKNDSDSFITSDSPGVSIDINLKGHNIEFTNDRYHFMPISSKVAIALYNPDFHIAKSKIAYEKLDSKDILTLNKRTASNRIDNIYCNSSSFLSTFTEQYKKL